MKCGARARWKISVDVLLNLSLLLNLFWVYGGWFLEFYLIRWGFGVNGGGGLMDGRVSEIEIGFELVDPLQSFDVRFRLVY